MAVDYPHITQYFAPRRPGGAYLPMMAWEVRIHVAEPDQGVETRPRSAGLPLCGTEEGYIKNRCRCLACEVARQDARRDRRNQHSEREAG